jgi:HD-GYP domain-containing protein (c-di-GMP phosphodiesterase class II)
MKKIIRLTITNAYIPISPYILVTGETVPFDIHIKRYNDYVVIIKAGTILTKILIDKLMKQDQIFIFKNHSEKLNDYCSLHTTISLSDDTQEIANPIAEALSIKEKNSLIDNLEQKLLFVYSTSAKMMQHFFDSIDEKLNTDALNQCATEIVDTIQTDTNVMPLILKLQPEEYSLHQHCTNVAFFASIIGKMVHINRKELIEITYAGLVHDIGKKRISTDLLGKPSCLNEHEYELVKNHSLYGYEILKTNRIISPTILNGVKHHHEKLDGSGYPEGLRGKMIPKSARILSMCDVFDALTTKRSFRKNYTTFEALHIMKREMSSQLDEYFVDIFIKMHR